MFRPDLVISALFTRVGWRQPTQSDYAILTGNNIISLSGLYFNDYHSILTIKNIKETLEDEDISNANFNTWLENKQKACINRVLQGVFNRDFIIENLHLFINDGDDKELLTSEGKFVGYRINLANDTSYAVKVNSVSLLFDSNQSFNLKCYHSVKGVIWTKAVTATANVETVVNITDLYLALSSSTYGPGEFYIGYDQNDIVGKAIDYPPHFNAASIFGFAGMRCDANTTIDVDSVEVTYKTYGLNFEMTSFRDFTRPIVQNAHLFDEAVGLQMAVDIIEQIIFSSRSNKTERITREVAQALYTDLNQDMPVDDAPYSAGLKNRLKREIQRLNKNFLPKDTITTVQS